MPVLTDALLSLFIDRAARRRLRRVRERQRLARRLREVGLIDREAQAAQLGAQARHVGESRRRDSRGALIDQAKRITRQRQDALSELDPAQRARLRDLAQSLMMPGSGKDGG